MLIVLFPAGAFGTTVEYSIRRFSNELATINGTVLETGSMHSFKKEFHPNSIDNFINDVNINKDVALELVTPVYPGNNYLTPAETITELKKHIDPVQKLVLIHLTDLKMSERNELFNYYKNGEHFLTSTLKGKHINWNSEYTSYKDMQIFELREALSFFIDQQGYHLDVSNIIEHNWLSITPDDILGNFKETILRIIKYFELTFDESQNIDEFHTGWFEKQQYILKEFDTINSVVNAVNSDKLFEWSKLSILGEAIVQSRLRRQGIELACYQLNEFPNNTDNLKKVLI